MDLSTALAGLDEHPWATVSHAYGCAEDLPDLLRALAEGDDGAAEEAVSELYGSILHQGTVYSASVDAVPYLAWIAAAGTRTADVLCLLGGLAESEDEWQVPEGAVRAAVVAQLPLLLPLLADPDETVRLAAAWAVGHTRDGAAAPSALGERWAAEQDPEVAAELLVALGRVDLSAAAGEARVRLGEETPVPLRLAAVLVCLRNEERWGLSTTRPCSACCPPASSPSTATASTRRSCCTRSSTPCWSATPTPTARRPSTWWRPPCATRAPRCRPRPCGRPTTPATSRAAPRPG